MAHTFNKINQNSITLKKGGIKLTKIQTNIGDLKKHLEDLQSIITQTFQGCKIIFNLHLVLILKT